MDDDLKLSPEREARIAAIQDAMISRKTWMSRAEEREVAEAKAVRRAELGPWWRRVLRFGR
jgi:hypothetical protein